MQRRHAEDALAGKLERCHLQHHRHRLHHEHAAHDEQHDLLAHRHRHRAERRAQRQRADVAHEHHGGIGVEPQETESGADDGAAENQHLASAGDVGKPEVGGEIEMAHDVGEHAQRRRHHDRRHDGEPVEPVGQVHGVARSHNHQVGQQDVGRAEVNDDVLEQRHDERGVGRAFGAVIKEQRHRQAANRLPEKLGPGADTARVLVDDFLVVVHPADGAEGGGGEQHRQHEAVGQVGPQQGGGGDGDEDHRPAHGRGTGLGEMRLRTVLTHRLSQLAHAQEPDHRRPDPETDHERGQHAEDGAQRDVTEHVQEREFRR